MKYGLSILLSGLLTLSAAAQTPPPTPAPDPVPGLIQERERLVREYEEASAQRNALLANKPSKKDLQEVIDVLKGIIRKDTEIVKAIKESSLRRTANIVAEKQQAVQQVTVATTDQTATRQRFYDLQNRIQDLELRDKQREKKLQEALATAKEAEAGRTTPELLAAGLALLSAALLWVIFRQRQQLSAAPARRHQ